MSTRLASATVACALALAFIATQPVPNALAQENWSVQDSSRRILLPGVLDLEVIDGSFIPADCQFATPPADCVAMPIRRDTERNTPADFDNLDDDYVRALESQGWRYVSGPGNWFEFERPIASGMCSQNLRMVFWFLGDPNEVAKIGTEQESSVNWNLIPFATFIFSLAQEPVCRADRATQ